MSLLRSYPFNIFEVFHLDVSHTNHFIFSSHFLFANIFDLSSPNELFPLTTAVETVSFSILGILFGEQILIK